ncbi:discoidin domain-containing protein [Streptomyces sp. NPDC004976]
MSHQGNDIAQTDGERLTPTDDPGTTRRGLLRSSGLAGATALGLSLLPGTAHGLAAAPAGADPTGGSKGGRRYPTTVPDEVMREVYEEVKTPYRYGPVLTTPADAELVDSPSVFRHRDRWYMVHLVFREDGYETRLASSPDLLDWTPEGTVLPFRPGAWDQKQAAGYIALQDPEWGESARLQTFDGRFWMSYLGGADPGYEGGPLSIGVASTRTPHLPEPWTRRDAAVLGPEDRDTRYWERSKLFKSNVVQDPQRRLGARFVMYYNATGAGGYGNETIGMAVSDDMVHWRRHGEAPVLTPYEWHGIALCGDPQVVRMGDLWVMFFWNTIDYTSNGRFDSFACSYDLVNWTPWRGQKLTSSTRPWEANQATKPWVVKHDGVVFHFYNAQSTNGTQTIGLATSKDLRGESAGPITVSASHTWMYDSPQAVVDGAVADHPRWTAYNSPNTVDWLQLDFDAPRHCSGLTVHLYDDGGGVQPPRQMFVEHLRGRRFEQVTGARWDPAGPRAGANTVTFSAVRTSSLRLHFVHREGGYQRPGKGTYSGATEIRLAP